MLALGVFLLVVSLVVSLVGSVMFAVAAFRVSLMWGLLTLFVPFAGLVFLVKYWAQAKRGFLVGLAGTAVAVMGYFALGAGLASRAQAHLGNLAAQMQSEMEKQQARAASAPAAPRPVVEPARPERESAPPSGDFTVRSPLLPEVPADAMDLADPTEVRTRDLTRHVGEDLLFVQKDGDPLRARLVAVNGKTVTVERLLHGGTVQYDVPLASIRTVKTQG